MDENKINEPQFEEMTEQEARELKKLLNKFIKSYGKKGKNISDKDWLKGQFRKELPNLTEEEAEKMATDTVDSIREYDGNLKSLNEDTAKGINKEQWLANEIGKTSVGISVMQHGEYLRKIDNALSFANARMFDVVTTKSGDISQCNNLDGFIAEQYHVNTFNANAALTKSKYFAEVKVPEAGGTYGKNSFDIVIRDTTNPKATPVHQYQVKYGATAKETIKMLKDHGEVTRYSNQQIVVPPEQVEEIRKAFPGKTITSQIGGTVKVPITSNKLTKASAKELQSISQDLEAVPTVDWNLFKTKELALQIGRNASLMGLQAAAITTGFSLASKVIKRETIDVDETVETALKTGADAGIKVATTGALKVGVERGIIRFIPQGTPVGVIANIACVGIENIKILAKVASRELTMTQAMDRMEKTTVSMVLGLGWGSAGMGIGAISLSWVPIVGPIIGGLVGGMIGYMAGSKFGEAVYNGVKVVRKGVVNVCKFAWDGIKSVGSKIKSSLFG